MVGVVRTISLDDMHSENIWFSWYKPSKYREKLICHACDGGRTEDGKWKIGQCSVGPETTIIFTIDCKDLVQTVPTTYYLVPHAPGHHVLVGGSSRKPVAGDQRKGLGP